MLNDSAWYKSQHPTSSNIKVSTLLHDLLQACDDWRKIAWLVVLTILKNMKVKWEG
jgi:hypothetical protein